MEICDIPHEWSLALHCATCLFFQRPAVESESLRRESCYGRSLLRAAQHALLLSLKIDVCALHCTASVSSYVASTVSH